MLNRVILMGRLTAEPDYRTTQSGVAMVRFRLAVDRDFIPQGGEKQTDFLDIIAWRNTADFVSKYFHKGQLVAVQGSIQVSNYTDREGNKRRSWDIVADQVYFAEAKRDNGYQNNYDYSRYDQMTPPPAPAQNAGSYSEPVSSYQSGSEGDFTPVADDDLPF
ncbi:MAG: single-stranded DNA-binding protein [Clostridia bacterium]|nr:single-stranded DNA-binding protein [Clostridia bacterium]